MAKRKVSAQPAKITLFIIIALVAGLVTLSSYRKLPDIPTWNEVFEAMGVDAEYLETVSATKPPQTQGGEASGTTGGAAAKTEAADSLNERIPTLEVHILDVGQADCILIKSPEKAVLIDAGERGDSETIVNYLKANGIKKLDIVINTHPHADHMGGMPEVFKAFKVDKFYMSKIPESIMPTNSTFNRFIDALEEYKIKINYLESGDRLDLGGGAEMNILAPGKTFSSLNNVSIASRVTFGEIAFVFTGDIEKESEALILKQFEELSADVLSLAHHGSSTSSTDAFLKAVSPKFATVSVGASNDYGHPHRETLQKLKAAGTELLRTDLNGNIVLITDGESLVYETDR